MTTPSIVPTGIHLHPDNSRVLVRTFIPSDTTAVLRIIERALLTEEQEVTLLLTDLHKQFGGRHQRIEAAWRRSYSAVRSHIRHEESLSEQRRLYIGALFSGEYALESAALFNPSIVPHPDQSGLAEDELRFVMSLRATGEGHISSITFRTGVIGGDHSIRLDGRSSHVSAPELHPDPVFSRGVFFRKLAEMEFDNHWTQTLKQSLPDRFTRGELNAAMLTAKGATRTTMRESRRMDECIRWLAEANYEVRFDHSIPLSERVIFPVSPNESNGIEDARFVMFQEDDGAINYYATYTAYNGRAVLPQLLETSDFDAFRAVTLNGSSVRNKGMALFPRRVGGRFLMVSRQDDENLYLMESVDLHVWEEARLLRKPMESWEAVKIGNCGSPIETAAGWLLLTHGVGPMRRYCIGAILLDLEDPSTVLGHLRIPLLEPDEPLRNGYVPNVVYTCGSIIHHGKLILPYGLSDTSVTMAVVDLAELLENLDPFREKE
ncbi:glycoside hydrolase family 130 protein [Luteolibacter sp. SL250]|uniref:glycoside hydrolase family 130 protein n=1 Tax=Luteolibacter sp. SL250 TaxID=2995170 RepID=UPI002270DC31|nr:glycoside hydrolase family 130 protein [Luteolibacter sp. SL250]WAC19035.1 glycoside hydrolase family 130 protein [Luteolibacter sp. SL250]